MDVKLPESREKEIFLELLKRPEKCAISADVEVSMVARYGISLDTVEDIRRKGMARDWPPLD